MSDIDDESWHRRTFRRHVHIWTANRISAGAVAFLLVLAAGLGYAAFSIFSDISDAGEQNLAIGAFVLLGIALLIALGFEFVNGFHDTANAVATVIYTHSLPPLVAVIWSGTLQLPRRADLERRGRLYGRHACCRWS